MLPPARRPPVRPASTAAISDGWKLWPQAWLMIRISGRRQAARYARSRPSPRACSAPPIISDAALSPVEPISVLRSRDSRLGDDYRRKFRRASTPVGRAIAKRPASVTHQLHPAEELGFDKHHFDRQHHHRQYAVEEHDPRQ